MGLLMKVRLSSFFAGAATASVAGLYLLYKDYMIAHEAISNQVKDVYESLDGRYEALNRRVTELENLKEVETATPMESSEKIL